MMTCERIALSAVDWNALDAFPDRTVFQTRAWLDFLAETQHAEPVVAELREGGAVAGFFTGAIVRKLGFAILGSPFPGWTSAYMGFNLQPGADRQAALAAVLPFAFNELGCLHVEVMDRRLGEAEGRALGMTAHTYAGFEVDLQPDEEAIFGAMDSACRRCIRKAEKSGVVVEEAHDLEFADDFYAQLTDVFAKQGLVPTYTVDRVRALITHLLPTGNLLLLRARDAEGACLASAIIPAFNDTMYFWGGASWRAHQILRPNELVQWYAMRYWKARGIIRYDMGGAGEYKRKYGVSEIAIPWLRRSKYPALSSLRDTAKSLAKTSQRVTGKVLGRV